LVIWFAIHTIHSHHDTVRVSIVTPSFRSSAWLKLCIASVADQGGEVEHIVQDAGSDDGTLEWLTHDRRVKAFVEKDNGMYDAVNRGFRHATGQVLGYLNSDEQYLPGALKSVAVFFEHNPSVDVLFGDVIMVSTSGDYLWNRKMQVPLMYHTWTCHLSTLSCATFFRSSVFEKYPFTATLKDAGDGEWMVRLLRDGVPMATLGAFTSAFTLTGANMSTGANARRENAQLRESAPPFVRHLKPMWVVQHRLRRLTGGMYLQQPFSYQLFTLSSPNRRVTFHVERPKCTSAL
jgi:glycosyltransferase involved in cell wall biosynthesis